MTVGASIENRVSFGKRLKLLRAKLNVTQLEMAKLLAVSVSHYSKMEIGAVGLSHALAYLICREFGVDRNWLLTGNGRAPEIMTGKSLNITEPEESGSPAGNLASSYLGGKALHDLKRLEKIIALLRDPAKGKLAAELAAGLSLDINRAWALVISETLKDKRGRPRQTILRAKSKKRKQK